MSNETNKTNEIKKEDISDEQVKGYMIQNQFDNQSLLDILAGMTTGMLAKFGHDLAVRNVNLNWGNMTGADIDDLKDQIVNQIKANAKNAEPSEPND